MASCSSSRRPLIVNCLMVHTPSASLCGRMASGGGVTMRYLCIRIERGEDEHANLNESKRVRRQGALECRVGIDGDRLVWFKKSHITNHKRGQVEFALCRLLNSAPLLEVLREVAKPDHPQIR